MKKKLSKISVLLVLMLTLAVCFAFGASAETFTGDCGAEGSNVTWTFDSETGELVISGEGAMYDYGEYETNGGWYYRGRPYDNYISDITSVIIEEGVTKIGAAAFADFNNLKTVEFSDSVIAIGDIAFVRCTSLTNVAIPETVTNIGKGATFSGCTKLYSVNIPEYITEIGPRMFELCESLTEIAIPDGVTSIGDYAFYQCGNLQSVSIPNNLKNIGACAFSDCSLLEDITLNEGLEIIGASAFNSCKKIDFSIPTTVKEIGSSAFWNCENLKSAVIPEGVKAIENETFTFSGIESVELPESLTSIGERAFLGTNITEITIPKNVSHIGSEALTRSYSLEYINVDEENAYFCNDEYGALYDASKENLIQYPVGNKNTSYIVSETVTNICSSAVDGGLYLKNITLPEGLKTIDNEAFVSCAVSEIILPSTLESIGWGAFTNCIFLEELVIPESVKTIGDSIVYGFFPVDVYVESMDAVIDEAAFGFGNMVVEGISKEDFFDLFVKIYTAPTGTSTEDLEKLENNALQYVTMYDEPIPFGKIYCHEGSTTETNIETLIDEYGFAADYEYTHFFKNWTYDWDGLERTAKCIHCDETTTESLRSEEDNEIEFIAPADEETTFVVETVEDEASEDYILVTEALEAVEGPAEIEKIYDITLQNSDNVAIQPDGSVQVKLPVENTHENYKVFRVNEDGTYTDMNATVVDGYVVFVTDHFSLYVIVDTTEAHEHSYTEKITKPATHMVEGEKTFTCSACGDSYTEVIEKDPKHHAELKHKSATCTEDGYERAVCECGFVMVDKVYEKLGHFYNYTVTLHPTHTREGSEIADCIRCDDTFTNTIDKLPDHYYGYFVKTYDPTCTEGGYTVHQCSCGDSYTDSYTSALGHTRSKNGDWCSVCGVDMEPEKKDCDHMCHQSGFMGFIWSIVQFFWKLFKMNPVCECGAAHY